MLFKHCLFDVNSQYHELFVLCLFIILDHVPAAEATYCSLYDTIILAKKTFKSKLAIMNSATPVWFYKLNYSLLLLSLEIYVSTVKEKICKELFHLREATSICFTETKQQLELEYFDQQLLFNLYKLQFA